LTAVVVQVIWRVGAQRFDARLFERDAAGAELVEFYNSLRVKKTFPLLAAIASQFLLVRVTRFGCKASLRV